MATIVSKARGDNADFVIHEVHGLNLVYHKTRTGALQLVLPKSHGLRKTIAMLQQCFWWPKLPKHVAAFVKGRAICHCIKDVNALLAGLL